MNTREMTIIALLLTLPTAPLTASAGEGFYAGASVGTASLNDDFDGLEIEDDTAAHRFVGGWWVNRYFALEAGYQNFGDFEQDFAIGGASSKATLSADGYTLGLQGSYPVANKVAIFGRAGAFFWDGEAEINNVSQASPEETNPYLSVGLSYAFNDSFSINSDWTHYELESSNSDVYSVGFQYRFGK
jgi:OOP family OmpA-OmpF porin